jgi:hypothetical protein
MSLLMRVRRALEPTFAVERELGAGGMGIVFEAHDTRLERKVAVKVLRPESATAAAAHRFLREARLLARLKHPNVVQVHQAGEGDGLYWFVMDLVQGETLASRLDRGPLSEKETVSLARELLSALAVAHEHGIVHRDIKPANIFLENGHALLADFGIARTTTTSDSESGITATKEVIGTPAYMAPEQMTGDVVGPAADQYSLALVMYECLTGKRWPPLQTASSGDWRLVPSALAPVIRRAIASTPAERWPGARAMSAALIPRRPRWPLLAAAAVTVAAALVWMMWRPSPSGAGPYQPGAVIPVSRAGLQAWNQAEALYFRGAWREADTAYRSALARHSCLACEFRLVDVDRWLERRPDSGRIARLSAGLPQFSEPWGRLVTATLAPASQRVELLADLTTDYRAWPLAWYYRGSELFNRGSLLGHGWNEANDALTTLARLDSSFVPSWTDLTLVRIALGDSSGADSALRRLQTLPPAGGLAQAQRLMAALAFEFRFTPNGLALWQNMSRAPELSGMPEVGAGPRVLSGLGTPLGGVLLGRAFETTGQKPLQRSGLIAGMLGNVALGRIDSARVAGHRLNTIFPRQQFVAFGAMLDAANVLFDDASTSSDAARVEAMLVPFTRAVMPPLVRRDAAWLIALAAIRRRDPDAARATLRMLADEPSPGIRRTFITAALLGASGQADSAIAITNTIVTDLEAWDRTERSPLLRAAIRLYRARWFEAIGSPENARAEYRWHQHFHLPDYPVDDPLAADGDWAFSTLASWRQARLLDRGEQDVDICASYRLVAERWSLGEPRYRARADTARSRLAQLRCEEPA